MADLEIDDQYDFFKHVVLDENGALKVSGTNSKATNNVVVTSMSDFPTLVGGLIPLEDNTNYIISTANFTISAPFDLSGLNSVGSIDFGNNTNFYTGSGALFQGSYTGAFVVSRGVVVGDSSEPIWSVTGVGATPTNVLIPTNLTFVNFSAMGIVSNIYGLNHTSVQYSNCGVGIILKDINITVLLNTPISNTLTTNSPKVVMDGVFDSATVRFSSLNILSGESFIQMSKDLTINSQIIIDGNTYNKDLGGEFFASNKTGSTTSFSDNGAGGTTVTSVAHLLTIEQTVSITGSGVYDATHNDIFNVTANSFDINTPFTTNPAAGTWDTGDTNIYRDNISVDSRLNGDDEDSNELSSFNSANTITVPIVASSSDGSNAVAISGSAIDWASQEERRFELQAASDPNGSVRYVGRREISFRLSARISHEVSGGSSTEFTGYITKNGLPLTESRFSVASSRLVTLNPEAIVKLGTNDYVGVAIENNDNTTNTDIIFVNLNIVKA